MSKEEPPRLTEAVLMIPRVSADGTKSNVVIVVKAKPQTNVQLFLNDHKLSTNTLFVRKFPEKSKGKQKLAMQTKVEVPATDREEPLPPNQRDIAEQNFMWFMLEYCDKEKMHLLEQGVPVSEVFREFVLDEPEVEDED